MLASSNYRESSLNKVLLISGSPVVGSSTEILLKTVGDSIRKELGSDATEIDFVCLNELKFIPCQACGEAPPEGFCIYDDDLSRVYEQVASCDCLVLGSPVYFDSVSAQTKSFIDRCNCFRPPDYDNSNSEHRFIKILDRHIPGGMILVGGERGWFEGARRVIAGFFKWLDITNDGFLYFGSRDCCLKGTVIDDPDILKQARELGHNLAGKILESKPT